MLLITQLIYIININAIIKQTLFFTNYRYNSNLFLKLKKVMILSEKAQITIDKMQQLHKKLWTNIKFLLHHSVFYYNQHHTEALMLKKRNKVYLLQRNIKTTRLSNKLDHIKIRLFKIVRNIKETSFQLKLPESMWQKHSVFYVFLLKSAPKQVPVLTQVLNNFFII